MSGEPTRRLSDEEIQQLDIIGRAANEGEDITSLFEDAGDPDLVNGLVKDVQTRCASAEKVLKHAEKRLAKGTLSDEDVLSVVSPLAESLMAALDAASSALGSTYFRDMIHDGESDDESAKAKDREIQQIWFTSAKAAFVRTLLMEVQQLKVACNPKYIRISKPSAG